MHSAIVVVEMPEMPYNATSNQAWQIFLAGVNRLQGQTPDHLDRQQVVERLGEKCLAGEFSSKSGSIRSPR